jgi:hypothetical protein
MRLVHLGWNSHMSAISISTAMGSQFSADLIIKHLREHVEDGAVNRDIVILDARPVAQRVEELQRMQLDEIERRIQLAQEWAARARDEGNPNADWSEMYDILSKDNQAAINTILKSQAVSDKREAKQNDQKVDLIKMMLGGGDGLAPKHLLSEGTVVEGEVVEISEPATEPDPD